MAKLTDYACDVCGARKGASNGWFNISDTSTQSDAFQVPPHSLILHHFGDGPAEAFHLCSNRVCVMTIIEHWMAKGTVATYGKPVT